MIFTENGFFGKKEIIPLKPSTTAAPRISFLIKKRRKTLKSPILGLLGRLDHSRAFCPIWGILAHFSAKSSKNGKNHYFSKKPDF
jgi:hypothetical protein